MLEVKNLRKSFGNQRILKNINFKINKGEILVVLGPSGCGKSTLLRCIKGLEDLDKGEVIFKGDFKDKIGIVFQEFNIWEHMTVLENLMLAPLVVQNRDKDEVHNKSIISLEKVNLADKVNSYPHQLSGGQKQRVAIARSLMTNPDLLLLDEVTSSLDPELVRSVLDAIKNLAKDGMSMIIVTHDHNFAKEIGDKFLFMDNGDVVRFGGEEVFSTKTH